MHSSLNTDFTYNGVTYAYNTDQESIALGDNFLSRIVPTIMASQAYKNNGAYNSTFAYTHSSDLKSMQELFGVSAPGGGFLGDANTPGTNDLSDVFVPGVFMPSSLSGTVFKNSGNDGQVEAGLTIVLTGTNDAGQDVTLTTTTDANGFYSFDGLLPGTYDVTVQGAKKHAGISKIALGTGQTLSNQDFSLLGPHSRG